MIPAFAPNDKCSLKGSALYLTLAAGYSGKAALEQHEVPIDIHQIVEGKKSSNFNPWKTKANWRQRLHELLWLEEAQMGVLTRAYDLADVQAEAVPELREADGTVVYPAESLVRVPCDHLAEKRPSVQRGDRVLAWAAGGPAHIQHEGFVHQVEGGSLVILFSKGFKGKLPLPTRLQMRFAVDRLAMRLMHRAVDDTQLSVAWPEPPVLTSAADADDAAAIAAAASALVVESELNDSQRSVDARLLRRTHGGAPFLLYGPFGTAKTRTLVEYVSSSSPPRRRRRRPPPPPPRRQGGKAGGRKPPAKAANGAARAAAARARRRASRAYLLAVELVGRRADARAEGEAAAAEAPPADRGVAPPEARGARLLQIGGRGEERRRAGRRERRRLDDADGGRVGVGRRAKGPLHSHCHRRGRSADGE